VVRHVRRTAPFRVKINMNIFGTGRPQLQDALRLMRYRGPYTPAMGR